MIILYGKENRDAFKEIRKICRQDAKLRANVRKSCENQLIYHEKDVIPGHMGNVEASEAKVRVSEKGVLEAVRAYAGKKVCVLNATSPGGSPEFDRNSLLCHPTWEEQLCSCTTLYPALAARKVRKQFYSLYRRQDVSVRTCDCIYTPDITVLREGGEMPFMPRELWHQVNVLSCVPPNMRENITGISEKLSREALQIRDGEFKELFGRCFCRILDIAKLHGNSVVIFGRFGCDYIACPPAVLLSTILMPEDLTLATDSTPTVNALLTTVIIPAAVPISSVRANGRNDVFLLFPKVIFEAARDAVEDHLYDFEAIEFAFGCTMDDSYSKILAG